MVGTQDKYIECVKWIISQSKLLKTFKLESSLCRGYSCNNNNGHGTELLNVIPLCLETQSPPHDPNAPVDAPELPAHWPSYSFADHAKHTAALGSVAETVSLAKLYFSTITA